MRRWILVAALVLAACGNDKSQQPLAGIVMSPPIAVGSLSLPDTSGEVAFRAKPGHLLLTFFGYTNCPDVCPTTMADIKQALKKLGSSADSVEVAMVSVDPRRDTAPILTSFVHGFVPTGHALRTDDPAALKKVADGFGAAYSVVNNADGSVEVSHSGNVYIVDSTGHLIVEWPFGLSPATMANDLSILLRSAP
jgi:protein SCO1/2